MDSDVQTRTPDTVHGGGDTFKPMIVPRGLSVTSIPTEGVCLKRCSLEYRHKGGLLGLLQVLT